MKPILQYRAVVLIESECEREREREKAHHSRYLLSISLHVYFFFNIPFIRCALLFLPKFAYDFWNVKRVYACARLALPHSRPPIPFFAMCCARRCSQQTSKAWLRLAKTTLKRETNEWKSRYFNQGEEFWLVAHEKYAKNCHWILGLSLSKGSPHSRAFPISWLKTSTREVAVNCISSQHLFQKVNLKY